MAILRSVIAFLSLALVMPVMGQAATTPTIPQASMSLLDGGRLGPTEGLAGIEIILSAKTKTYWRMPGDSGLPPLFDWSGSDNVAAIRVEWPRPERIDDASGTILGYHGHVVFPVVYDIRDPSKPVTLALKLDFGICEDVCVPMTLEARRALGSGGDEASITAFRAQVPLQGQRGAPPDPRLVSIIPDAADPKALLVQAGAPIVDLILEGPKGWYFGDAARAGGPDSAPLFRVHILEKPAKGALGGLPLTVTLLGREAATETSVTLDPDGAIR